MSISFLPLTDVTDATAVVCTCSKAAQLACVPLEHRQVFSLLLQQVGGVVKGSAYNWIRPSLWTTVFSKSLGAAAAAAAKNNDFR
jgi:hypothetical protein